ncbi:HAD family hydrolase [Bacillus salacetis]|uniref:HAD family hydrolase n=1 Tax=Bacillus salacetis TaxID=2315464 RepID=A0A3A1QWV5_9BACI|nr:HAD family hydrolase [Bacillus salacetis]RIW32736.1 HAD family hydrolase [Bacillus salacetis]
MKAILFDLDRTLHDRDASVLAFLEMQHQKLNALHHTSIPRAYIDRFIELECKGYVWKDKVYSSLAEEYSLPLSAEDLLHDYRTNFHSHCLEMDGAAETLHLIKAKGYKLGMITNGRTDVQNGTIDALGLRDYFDMILISEEAGVKKPDVKIFEMAAEALNVSPSECLYVGDHYENDAAAAMSAGMKAAWLADGDSPETKADIKVGSLAELRKHL